jgi:mxaK protein
MPADRFRRAWARTRPRLLLALPLLLLAGAIGCAALSWRADSANREIAALAQGRDRPVAADAPAPILLARVLQLAHRDATEEMEPLVAALETRGAPTLVARARYALGNARLRRALDLIERGQLDPAGPLIVLARQEYRRALQARPEFWDAKFNLDVAARLIRDFPEVDREVGDELKAEPKRIWTDIPGQPRGAP